MGRLSPTHILDTNFQLVTAPNKWTALAHLGARKVNNNSCSHLCKNNSLTIALI